MLRYGDGTPFPFGDGFLDMLVDAVEACTTMLAATANLERRRADAEAVLQAIGEEERQLLMFERAVAAACGASPDGKATPAARAAERTLSAMASAVELSREQLRQISSVKAASPSWHRTARRVHAAAGRFFSRRQLPNTRWAWAWDTSGVVPHAEAASQDARFRVVFDLDLPPAWRAPVRIDALVPDLVVQLPRRRFLRRPVETAIPLGRCLLVGARHDDRGRELVIRKPDGSGWRIELPLDAQPSALALDRRGRPAGTGLVRETELAPLIDAIDRELATPQLPRHAREVLLDGARLTEIADTSLAARALLDELGPTVRAIRQRSRMTGELTLKRDVADGRREELYVSRASLTARYASLPAEQRRLLDDAGFGRGLTSGIAELPAEAPQAPQAAPRARPTTPPAPPRPSTPSLPARASAPRLQPRPARTSAPPRDYPSEPRLPTEPSNSPRALAETVLVTAPPAPAGRPRQETMPLLSSPPRPSAPVLPITPLPVRPRATPDPEQARRRCDDPTIPSVIIAPSIRSRADRSSDLSEVVTPLFPHIPVRRLATPTG